MGTGSRILRNLSLAVAVGLLAGLSSAIFLHLLDAATRVRLAHPALIWFLPMGGLAAGLLYHRYGRDAGRGHNLILEEIHDPKQVVPLRMAPMVLLGTLATHLFGGAAGREGAAVQMSGSLADQLSLRFCSDARERRMLLVAGMGAGFGAAMGAPFAGAIFGMEVVSVVGITPFAVLESLIASFVGFFTSVALRAPHSIYAHFPLEEFRLELVGSALVMGVLSGWMAILFVRSTHLVERAHARARVAPWLRPALGGALLVALYLWLSPERYAGLGIPVIQDALQSPARLGDPFAKWLLTSVTVGSGFKGGEFVPLVFIGSTLGSALSAWLPGSVFLLGSLGFAAVFAGAANTPWACAVMAMELFGPRIGPYAALACLASYFCSGHHGIYGSQRLDRTKFSLRRKMSST